MFKLRTGYLLSGIATGLVLLFSFIGSFPDGKLHIVFCDVGQGDGAYIRFPDGRDMVVDGGPNDKILGCLSEHMPFWDRKLDIVLLTHPQKDHMQGLLSIFERYEVGYFIRSNIANTTEGFQKLMELVKTNAIKEKFVTTGEQVAIGDTDLRVLWPSDSQILGATTDLNDASIVFWLRYGTFDVIFTGDADTRVESGYRGSSLVDEVEVLKVPHHGSKTGMTDEYLDWLSPDMAVISVGKNSYGHPADLILNMLKNKNINILRTDLEGAIEVVSDGTGWGIDN